MPEPDLESLLDDLASQAVETLGHFNVSIGGFNVNGINGPREMHPLVRIGPPAIPALLDRITRDPLPLKEILILNAIAGRPSVRIEAEIAAFREPPGQFVREERNEILLHFTNRI